ncbi:hypothetical protein [Natranaerofaba carboxydovora]|uniref:hypothetical protein n=1 Tax=Natranaerofaba carboxydovora TaxID=2742683 RepID=UPI001F139829|nr:hypothetical protein [Natranaerofaba carboxydovora]UMZ74147.1 hypothetical protein ACONDI_01727 [Natranaerofaba carboxydovora]
MFNNPIWLVLLICPLIHIIMMLFMKGGCHKGQEHGKDNDQGHNTQNPENKNCH